MKALPLIFLLLIMLLLQQACSLHSVTTNVDVSNPQIKSYSTNVRLTNGTRLNLPAVETFKLISQKNIFMQQEDYSCGAASLATLMHYYFNEDTDESRMLAKVKNTFTEEEYKRIENDGLSFLELEKVSADMGYQSASVRLPVDALEKLNGPVIVYLQRADYQHFAVLKGIAGDRVYIADPSRGNIRVSRTHFLKEWDGRTFVLGKPDFSPSEQHALLVDARSNNALERTAIGSRLFQQAPPRKPSKPTPRRLE